MEPDSRLRKRGRKKLTGPDLAAQGEILVSVAEDHLAVRALGPLAHRAAKRLEDLLKGLEDIRGDADEAHEDSVDDFRVELCDLAFDGPADDFLSCETEPVSSY